MIQPSCPLILGSGSPRRRLILQTLGIPIRVIQGDAVELVHPGESPSSYLKRIVLDKLVDVSQRIDPHPFGGLLVADTIVVLNEQILGKPIDEEDARRMLRQLSGQRHEVWTRFALASPNAPAKSIHEQTVCTRVFFRTLSKEEVLRYAASGEGQDKAGAYAIQGIGSFAVEKIDGSYPNVVGLPACEVVSSLIQVGLMDAFPL